MQLKLQGGIMLIKCSLVVYAEVDANSLKYYQENEPETVEALVDSSSSELKIETVSAVPKGFEIADWTFDDEDDEDNEDDELEDAELDGDEDDKD